MRPIQMQNEGPAPHAWIGEALHGLERCHARRHLVALESGTGPRVQVDGRRLLNFSANDYLGLAGDPRLAMAAAEAARRWGTGAGASRLITGTLGLHNQLEARIAALKGAESALLFGTGYQANVGVLQALADEGVVFSDALNHASIVDGCRLARAKVVIYRHGDAAHLAELLQAHRSAQRKLIVSDGLFSMDGDLAPLPALAELALQHEALLVVDDAHGTGVLGGGRGVAHHFGLTAGVHVHVGTFSKAFGSFGAFVACPADTRELLIQRARSLVFTTAPPPPCVGAALKALAIMAREPERLQRLAALAADLRHGLRQAGFQVSEDPTPIVPLILGSRRAALAWSERLWQAGFWVQAIRPPTVPEGTSRLRITLSAGHDAADVGALVQALATLRRELPREEGP